MYLQIGQDRVVRGKDIIGIFDLDNTTVSKITRDMLSKAEKSGNAVTIGYDIPKSYIITNEEDDKTTVFISPVTPTTLTKRIQKNKIGPQTD